MAEKLLNREYLYRGRRVNLRLDRVELENGNVTTREIVEHPGSVVIVALDDEARVLLVRQYRQAAGRDLLELPAGTLDKRGESIEHAAQRELEEETGCRATQWREITEMYPSPGISTEDMHLWFARGLEPSTGHGEEDEEIRVERVPLAEAVQAIVRGEIVDGKTIAGVLLAALELGV